MINLLYFDFPHGHDKLVKFSVKPCLTRNV